MGSSFRGNLTSIILVVIVLLMGIEILYLIRQNRQLLRVINNPVPARQTLEPGARVRPFSASNLDGHMVALDYGPRQPYRLLLWFSTTCPACIDNLPFWDDLFQELASDNLHLLGICSEDPADVKAMADAYSLDFPIIVLENLSIVEAYSGYSRPQTILVGPEGLIRGVWPGSLGRDRQEIIRDALTEIHTLTGKGGEVQ